MRPFLRITRTLDICTFEVPLAIIEHNLLFGPDIPQRLEQHHMPSTQELAVRLNVRPAVRVDEACPVASVLGIDGACLGDLDAVQAFSSDV